MKNQKEISIIIGVHHGQKDIPKSYTHHFEELDLDGLDDKEKRVEEFIDGCQYDEESRPDWDWGILTKISFKDLGCFNLRWHTDKWLDAYLYKALYEFETAEGEEDTSDYLPFFIEAYLQAIKLLLPKDKRELAVKKFWELAYLRTATWVEDADLYSLGLFPEWIIDKYDDKPYKLNLD